MSDQKANTHLGYCCPWCAIVIDAEEAQLCNCITKKRTLNCTNCLRCFCDAGADWRLLFMRSPAASVLWQKAREQQGGAAPTLSVMASPLKRPLILVVDDDKVVQSIAARVLADLGGTVLFADNGEEGLRLAIETLPDLLITDALLPKLDGREMARLIKTMPTTRHCKVIVVTAIYKGLRYRAEAIKRFMVDDYLEKPVTPSLLHSIVMRLLDGVGSQKMPLHHAMERAS